MTKRKPRITREQAIEQAVRNTTPPAYMKTMLRYACLGLDVEGMWKLTLEMIRAEFARLTR